MGRAGEPVHDRVGRHPASPPSEEWDRFAGVLRIESGLPFRMRSGRQQYIVIGMGERIWVQLTDGPYAGERTQQELDECRLPPDEFNYTTANVDTIGAPTKTMPLSTYQRQEQQDGVWQYKCIREGGLG